MKLVLISTLVILGLASGAFGGDGFSKEYLTAVLEAAATEAQSKQAPVEENPNSRLAVGCSITTSSGTPTSVHKLRPSDIKIIGAIGDSLTAANGAKASSIAALIYEYRGVSWSMGCEDPDKTVSFASILKYFNKDLVGCSTGTGKQNSTFANLNLADPGDTSFDMLGQAKLLVLRLQSTVPDYKRQWKIVNFFIGGNDLCEFCDTPRQTVENFVRNIRETLDYLKQELPYTLVNLVLTLDVTGIDTLDGATCRNMQMTFCACGLDMSKRHILDALTKSYQVETKALIDSGRYDTDEIFTVNVHSFMTKMRPPKTLLGNADKSYFAPDCFHFSEKGHQVAGRELWNSMLTPYGSRREDWNLNAAIKCPTLTAQYIYTHKNSKSLMSVLNN